MSWYWWVILAAVGGFYIYVVAHRHGRIQGLFVGMDTGLKMGLERLADYKKEHPTGETVTDEHSGEEARDFHAAE